MAVPDEWRLALPGGLSLALKCWGNEATSSVRILAFHGWMDNSGTWDELAPHLTSQLGAFLVCVDFAGHGRSDHRHPSTFYSSQEYYANGLEVWHALKWAREEGRVNVVLGHSLGAGCASVLAAALSSSAPGALDACILIDGLGIYPRPIEDTVANFCRSVAAKSGFLAAPRSVYPSVDAMAKHRVAAVARNPGKQWISFEAARRLVERASAPASEEELADFNASSPGMASPSPVVSSPEASTAAATGSAGAGAAAALSEGFVFTHDPKIKGPSPVYFTEEQAREFLRAIRCPTLHVEAKDGWPRPREIVEAREALMGPAVLENVVLPGSHHLHADPYTAGAVLAAIVDFLRRKVLKAPPAAAAAAALASGSA